MGSQLHMFASGFILRSFLSLNMPRKSKRAPQLVLVRGSKRRSSVEESVHPDKEARSIVEEETPSHHLEGVEQEESPKQLNPNTNNKTKNRLILCYFIIMFSESSY